MLRKPLFRTGSGTTAARTGPQQRCQDRPPPAASDHGEAVVTLHPPVTVENRLPCGVLVTLQVGSRGESRVRVGPGGRGAVVDVDMFKSKLHVRLV
mgnify:CR=1 FL=1